MDALATLSGPTMGARFVVRAAVDPSDAAKLTAELQAAVDRVDQQMSTWKPDSVLNRFNAAAPGRWFDLPAEMAAVIAIGLEVGAVSSGAFDMTLGQLVDLWGFGPTGRAAGLPSEHDIAAALARVGHRHLALREDGRAISKTSSFALDLSGIAKGFGVDELARVLHDNGIDSFLAEIDGELRVAGNRPDGTPWRVAIALPVPGLHAAYGAISPGTTAIATSGDYRRFVMVGGRHCNHTIDSRTGHPVADGLASVTVLDQSCARADALASALMAMPPDAARGWAEENGVPAVLLRRAADRIDAQIVGAAELVETVTG